VVVTLPAAILLTARKEDKTFEEAIRSAFEAVTIELRTSRKTRGDRSAPATGSAPTAG
jgi:hypothetical protein